MGIEIEVTCVVIILYVLNVEEVCILNVEDIFGDYVCEAPGRVCLLQSYLEYIN